MLYFGGNLKGMDVGRYLADVGIAMRAPGIEWHFEPDLRYRRQMTNK